VSGTQESRAGTRAFARVLGPWLTIAPGIIALRAPEMGALASEFFKSDLSVWFTGAALLFGGLFIIAFHQYWSSAAAVLISLFGREHPRRVPYRLSPSVKTPSCDHRFHQRSRGLAAPRGREECAQLLLRDLVEAHEHSGKAATVIFREESFRIGGQDCFLLFGRATHGQHIEPRAPGPLGLDALMPAPRKSLPAHFASQRRGERSSVSGSEAVMRRTVRTLTMADGAFPEKPRTPLAREIFENRPIDADSSGNRADSGLRKFPSRTDCVAALDPVPE
jgi:hypothetical protein